MYLLRELRPEYTVHHIMSNETCKYSQNYNSHVSFRATIMITDLSWVEECLFRSISEYCWEQIGLTSKLIYNITNAPLKGTLGVVTRIEASNSYRMKSTKAQNPRRNSYAGLTFNSSYAHMYIHSSIVYRYCACAYECLAAPSRPSHVSCLFHAGCTSS